MSPPLDPAVKRVLIVDDHPVIRQGLTRLFRFEDDLDVCGEASNATEALAAVNGLAPHVAVIDISLGGEDGLQLVKDIVAEGHPTRLLVLSMHSESVYAERALRAGAMGYVMKEEPPPMLLRAVRQVLDGGIYVSPDLQTRWLTSVVTGDGRPSPSVDELTDRELLVFRLIGSGYGTSQIADHLGISVKTVESYREKIKRKLDLRSAPELAQQAAVWVYRESGG